MSNSPVFRVQSKAPLLAVILGSLVLFHSFLSGNCVPANPNPIRITQTDGTELTLKLKGDAFCNWLEDMDGYPVVRVGKDYFYAHETGTDGNMVASNFKVGHDNPHSHGLSKRLRPTKKNIIPLQQTGKKHNTKMNSHSERKLSTSATGSLKNLVIPIMFADHVNRPVPTSEDIDTLWNAPGGHPSHPTNASVREYYLVQSYGLLDLTSTVTDWVVVSKNESYYADGESGGALTLMELLREALTLADDMVDFSEFDSDGDSYIDAIAFVHSGYGAEYGGEDMYGTAQDDRIWSHKWVLFDENFYLDPYESEEGIFVSTYHMETALEGISGDTISTIGVAVHETGHFFGLPDLYDTDYSSSGISSWGVMANSWGWDGTAAYPPSFCAWSKYMLGWVEPIEVTGTGTFTVSDIQSSGKVYIISSPYPDDEYLLIEHRAQKWFDWQSPQDGLLIWHIDDLKSGNTEEGYYSQEDWPLNGNHYLVALLQADGNFDLEQGYGADGEDVFSGDGEMVYDSFSQHPSTLSYQNGNAYLPGFVIENIKYSSDSRSYNFTVSPGCIDDPEGILAANEGTCAEELLYGSCDFFDADYFGHAVYIWELCPASCGKCNLTVFNYTEATATGSISVSSPDGSTSYTAGDTVYISWTASGLSGGYVAVYLYKSETLVQTLSSYLGAGDGSWYWEPTLDSSLSLDSDYWVMIVDHGDSSTYGSSSYFTIEEATASISVTSPDGSTSYTTGDSIYISWTAAALSSDHVAVYLYKSVTLVQTFSSYLGAGDGSWFWEPILDSSLFSGSDYRVMIVDDGDSTTYGYSSYFTIEGESTESPTASPTGCIDDPDGIVAGVGETCADQDSCETFDADFEGHAVYIWELCPATCGKCNLTVADNTEGCIDDPDGILAASGVTCAEEVSDQSCDFFDPDYDGHAFYIWEICPASCGRCNNTEGDYDITYYENVGWCKGMDIEVDFEWPETGGYEQVMLACWEACYEVYGETLVAVDGPCWCQDSCDELECDGQSIYVRSDIELPTNCEEDGADDSGWTFSDFDDDGCTWDVCTDIAEDCYASEFWGEPQTCAYGLLPVPQEGDENSYKCCGVDYEGCTEDKCSSFGDDCWANEEDWGEPQTCSDGLLPVTSYWDESFYRCCGIVEEDGADDSGSTFSDFDDDGCTWDVCTDAGQDCYANEDNGESQTCAYGLLPVPQGGDENSYKCCGVDYEGCTEDKCSSLADDCWANEEDWGEPQTCYDGLLPVTSYWDENYYRCCGVIEEDDADNSGWGFDDFDIDGCTWELCTDDGEDCFASETWGEAQTCAYGLLPVPQSDENTYKCCGVDYAGCTEAACNSPGDDCWANEEEWGEPQTCDDGLLPVTSYWDESFYRCCGIDAIAVQCTADEDCGGSQTCVCLSTAEERKLRGKEKKGRHRNLLFGKYDHCYCA